MQSRRVVSGHRKFSKRSQQKKKLKKSKSFYFGQAFFLKNSLVDRVFQELEIVLSQNHSFNLSGPLKMSVDFKEYGDFTTGNKDLSVNYVFTISNEEERKYAHKLLPLYQYILKPFIATNEKLFARLPSDFARFFYISGLISEETWGKSVHNTSHIFDVTVHHGYRYIDEKKNAVLTVDHNYLNQNAMHMRVEHKHAYLAHFRAYFPNSLGNIPISYLHVDLNYLNCYFRPIVKRMNGN